MRETAQRIRTMREEGEGGEETGAHEEEDREKVNPKGGDTAQAGNLVIFTGEAPQLTCRPRFYFEWEG